MTIKRLMDVAEWKMASVPENEVPVSFLVIIKGPSSTELLMHNSWFNLLTQFIHIHRQLYGWIEWLNWVMNCVEGIHWSINSSINHDLSINLTIVVCLPCIHWRKRTALSGHSVSISDPKLWKSPPATVRCIQSQSSALTFSSQFLNLLFESLPP